MIFLASLHNLDRVILRGVDRFEPSTIHAGRREVLPGLGPEMRTMDKAVGEEATTLRIV
jgi:hypothetical protein